MVMTVLWLVVALSMIRFAYRSIKEKNYTVLLCSIVLACWAIYRVLCYSGVLPQAYVVDQTDSIFSF